MENFSSSKPPPSPHHPKYIIHKSKYIINVLCWGNALKRPSESFLLLFVIQQLHCQTFWFKWCWRFSGHFPTFCFFPIKTSSLSVSLSWITAAQHNSPDSMRLTQVMHFNVIHTTQCNSKELMAHSMLVIVCGQNIFGQYSKIFLVNTSPFPGCQWTLASLSSHWEFSRRFQMGCHQKTEETLKYVNELYSQIWIIWLNQKNFTCQHFVN